MELFLCFYLVVSIMPRTATSYSIVWQKEHRLNEDIIENFGRLLNISYVTQIVTQITY